MKNYLLSHLMWRNGSQFNQFIMAIMITIPVLNYGMVLGWMSPMTPVLQDPKGPAKEPLSDEHISWMASITFIVSLPFGFLACFLADRYGRKLTILITSFSLMLCWLVKLCSLHPWALILARSISGVACAGCYVMSPIYLKEISDDNIRGALGSLFILCQNLGYLIVYVAGDLLPFSGVTWLCFLIPSVHFITFLAMPETPAFLVKHNNIEEAKEVLAWLRSTTVEDKGVMEEIKKLEKEEEETKTADSASWKIIVKDKATFKAFCITLVVMLSQECCGYMIVLTYAGFIFEKAAESITLNLSPNKQTIVLGVVQFIGSVIACCIVEKTGRKWLLTATSFLTGVSLLVMGLWFYLTSVFWLPGWVPVAALCLCIFSDAAGYQPVPYVIMSELFNFQLRGLVTSIVISSCTFMDFVQTKAFDPVTKLIGIHWVFIMFAVMCFTTGTLYTAICVPETKEKSLEVIYEQLREGSTKKKRKNCDIEEHRF